MTELPSGCCDVMLVDGDINTIADDPFTPWIRLDSLGWPDVIHVVELARRQGLTVALYPRSEEAGADGAA